MHNSDVNTPFLCLVVVAIYGYYCYYFMSNCNQNTYCRNENGERKNKVATAIADSKLANTHVKLQKLQLQSKSGTHTKVAETYLGQIYHLKKKEKLVGSSFSAFSKKLCHHNSLLACANDVFA